MNKLTDKMAEHIVDLSILISLTVLSLFLAGDPDLMDAIIDWIKRH